MRTVAAFDFDGTICRGDAVIPFLTELRGAARTFAGLASLVPLLATRDRDVLKRALTKKLLTGVSEAELNRVATAFADRLLADNIFPDVRAALINHAQQGHEIIIVSASYDAYLKRAAEQLNVNTLISTRIEVVDGTCTGQLVDGINVRSHKKTELLMKALGNEEVELYAYGNSKGDVPMLAAATHPFMVSRSGRIVPWATTTRNKW